MRWWWVRTVVTAMLAVPLLVVGCAVTEDEDSPPETLTTTSSTTVARGSSTITAASTTTTAQTGSRVHDLELVPLEPEPYDSGPLDWTRTELELDRSRDHWLGTLDAGFVLLSWAPDGGDYRIQTSEDGRTWTPAEPAAGLPDVGRPVGDLAAEPAGAQVRTNRAGMIMAIGHDPWMEEAEANLVFTSKDGRSWAQVDPNQFEGSPYKVAASQEGFAVVTAIPGQWRGEWRNVMYVADADGTWRHVDIPHEQAGLGWLSGLGPDFMAKGPDQEHFHVDHPTHVVSTTGELMMGVSPGDHVPTPWMDGVLVHNAWNERRVAGMILDEPTFYTTVDAIGWERLPFPAQPDSDEPDHYQVTSIGAGAPDLLIAGCSGCQGHLEFYGNSFGGIEIMTGGYWLDVWGGTVLIFNAPYGDLDMPIINDREGQWFDVATGTLRIPADAYGPGLQVTCQEMRQAVIDMTWTDELDWALVDMVPQDLWHSPDGRAWYRQDVRTVFGPSAWIEQAATTRTSGVVLVRPNGERPISDPPGCELGFYPEEAPFQVWTTDLTSE